MMKLFSIVVSFLAVVIISIPLHEWGHSLAARCFGVSGTVTIDWASLSGWYSPGIGLTDWQWTVVGFSGGIFAALVLGLLLILCKRCGEGTLTALRVIIGLQFGFAIGEGFESETLSGILLLMGVCIAVIYSLPKLKRWCEYVHKESNNSTASHSNHPSIQNVVG